jgi:hypothetical protein
MSGQMSVANLNYFFVRLQLSMLGSLEKSCFQVIICLTLKYWTTERCSSDKWKNHEKILT